jgi:hypothetical protein
MRVTGVEQVQRSGDSTGAHEDRQVSSAREHVINAP